MMDSYTIDIISSDPCGIPVSIDLIIPRDIDPTPTVFEARGPIEGLSTTSSTTKATTIISTTPAPQYLSYDNYHKNHVPPPSTHLSTSLDVKKHCATPHSLYGVHERDDTKQPFPVAGVALRQPPYHNIQNVNDRKVIASKHDTKKTGKETKTLLAKGRDTKPSPVPKSPKTCSYDKKKDTLSVRLQRLPKLGSKESMGPKSNLNSSEIIGRPLWSGNWCGANSPSKPPVPCHLSMKNATKSNSISTGAEKTMPGSSNVTVTVKDAEGATTTQTGGGLRRSTTGDMNATASVPSGYQLGNASSPNTIHCVNFNYHQLVVNSPQISVADKARLPYTNDSQTDRIKEVH